MTSLLFITVFVLFVTAITVISYRLGETKTESARTAAVIGFMLSFLPPLALIYLVVLFLKDDAITV